jgi:hypothetical protein
MKPPPRLIEDGAIAPELRADLERIAATPARYDAGAGLHDFQRAIATANATPPRRAPGFGSSGAKIGALSAAAVVLAAAAVFAWSELTHPAATPKPATTTGPMRASGAGVGGRASLPAPTPAPTAPVPPTAAEPRPNVADPVAAAAPAGARAPAPDEALQREIAQLGRIKQLLPSDPQQAYRLAQAGHREFRAGMLRHEREGLAILALWQLGRDRDAAPRARAFLTRYPESPLREQLAQRLERAGERSPQED